MAGVFNVVQEKLSKCKHVFEMFPRERLVRAKTFKLLNIRLEELCVINITIQNASSLTRRVLLIKVGHRLIL